MSETHCFIISGRVQGIAMRSMIRQQAHSRGLYGFAKNMPDGTVQVLLQGSHSEIVSLRNWLKDSPGSSNVRSLQRVPAENRHQFVDFKIL